MLYGAIRMACGQVTIYYLARRATSRQLRQVADVRGQAVFVCFVPLSIASVELDSRAIFEFVLKNFSKNDRAFGFGPTCLHGGWILHHCG